MREILGSTDPPGEGRRLRIGEQLAGLKGVGSSARTSVARYDPAAFVVTP